MMGKLKVIDLATNKGLDMHPYAQATYKRIREDGTSGDHDELFLDGLFSVAMERLSN